MEAKSLLFILYLLLIHPSTPCPFEKQKTENLKKALHSLALTKPREPVTVPKPAFLGRRLKISRLRAPTLRVEANVRGEADIWSWAPALSQTFAKSTFGERPQPSIPPAPSGPAWKCHPPGPQSVRLRSRLSAAWMESR